MQRLLTSILPSSTTLLVALFIPFILVMQGVVTDTNLLFYKECTKLLMMAGQKSQERGSIDVYHISLHNTPQHTTKDEQECQKDGITLSSFRICCLVGSSVHPFYFGDAGSSN